MSLKFGIPTLDELLNIRGNKPIVDDPGAKTSMSILGPDGSGKSVLALHLASHYKMTCLKRYPDTPINVVYVSSDLEFASASLVWNNFNLIRPSERHIPFQRIPEEIERRYSPRTKTTIELAPLRPDKTLADFLLSESENVGFLDLASTTAGDDWTFVNSLIVNLPPLEGQKHLVIIDSVAGFETFVGTYDAYGIEQTRRSRIAQCMRNAENAHLVFVVEEPKDGERLPEEYVTDVVLRLRTRRENGRNLRTMEVEKARARNHAAGEHVFEIRSGGTSTGNWENPDTPTLDNAYVHVFHSLSHRNFLVAADRGWGRTDRTAQAVTPFGLHYLDKLLEHGRPVGERPWEEELWGLPAGASAAIIGDAGTGKSVLGEKYIAEGFRHLVEDALIIYFLLKEPHAEIVNAASVTTAVNRTLAALERPIIRSAGEMLVPDRCPDQSALFQDRRKCKAAFMEAWNSGIDASTVVLRALMFDGDIGTLDQRQKVVQERSSAQADSHRGSGDPPASPAKPPALERSLRFRSECYAELDKLESSGISFVERLFRHPNLRFPGILLTTGDRNVKVLANRCIGYLHDDIEKHLKGCFNGVTDGDQEEALRLVQRVLEEQLIVRRFDIDSVPSSALFDLVHRNVIEAEYLLHGAFFPPGKENRFFKADRIRLVIDDVRALANLCPAVSADSAFLPFLVFYLERQGVTALFVHTDGLRPGTQPEDPLSQALFSLLKQLILTWSVPFQGQTRTAISAIPASSRETNGIVREVEVGRIAKEDLGLLKKIIPMELPKIEVTPNFELYADLEKGAPKLIPLAVFLYSSTQQFRKYIDQEDVMFRMQFTPVPGGFDGTVGRVLWPIDASQYLATRDLTHLPWDAKADYTIVNLVDGFWSLEPQTGALASLRDYLMAEQSATHEDPFNLFRGKPLHLDDDVQGHYQRRYYFQNAGYRSRIVDFDHERASMPDRIPFMWDFSFLLLPVSFWEQAGKGDDEIRYDLRPGGISETWPKTVGEVLRILRLPREKRQVVPWRAFLGACKVVAEKARNRSIDAVAYDFAATSAETLTSMVIEIWFSEITLELRRTDHPERKLWAPWLNHISHPAYRPLSREEAKKLSLAELLCGAFHGEQGTDGTSDKPKATVTSRFEALKAAHEKKCAKKYQKAFDELPIGAICLYRTWLLLLEGFDFEGVLDPNNAFEIRQPKKAAKTAMAVRHYYRTACDQQFREQPDESGLAEANYACAMPGHFSVRGDSFLASPKASRSRLLAFHTFDLLCSRRANLTRMQLGIGLPVRDVLEKGACLKMRTALRVMAKEVMEEKGKAPERLGEISYEHLRELGARDLTRPELEHDADKYSGYVKDLFDDKGPEPSLRWLFRNGIPEYDRVSRPLQRWLIRVFKWTVSYKARHAVGWRGGFEAYDALVEGRFDELERFDSFLEFARYCDYLVKDLEAAERSRTLDG